LGFPQSSRAYASFDKPEAWANCDRCNFRYLHKDLSWQFDWRGNSLANLRILVCDRCLDDPQEQQRPIIIGPDPIPIPNPRPGFAATEMGTTTAPNILELVDGDTTAGEPAIAALGLLNDGGVLVFLYPDQYPNAPDNLPPNAIWSNGATVSIVLGGTSVPGPPVYFGQISALALVAIGGGGLPTTQPSANLQLWNNNGLVCVAGLLGNFTFGTSAFGPGAF
jgi:hypothetical protein